jgi:hypothetical protein
MNKKRTLFFETKTYLEYINERSTVTIRTLMIQKDYEYLVKRMWLLCRNFLKIYVYSYIVLRKPPLYNGAKSCGVPVFASTLAI